MRVQYDEPASGKKSYRLSAAFTEPATRLDASASILDDIWELAGMKRKRLDP